MCRKLPSSSGERRRCLVVDAHVCLRRERGDHVSALLVGRLAEVQPRRGCEERRPLGHCGSFGNAARASASGRRRASQRQRQLGVQPKVIDHVRAWSSGVTVAAAQYLARRWWTHSLAQQDGLVARHGCPGARHRGWRNLRTVDDVWAPFSAPARTVPASMRNPDAPSCSQNAMTFLISARTAGLVQFRSGWKS